MRQGDPDHWVKLLRRRLDAAEHAACDETSPHDLDCLLHIVTDVRQANELAALTAAGAVTVLVVREGLVWDGTPTEELAGEATRHYWAPPCPCPSLFNATVRNLYNGPGDEEAAQGSFVDNANAILDHFRECWSAF